MLPPSKKPDDLGDAINRTILPIDSVEFDPDVTLPTPNNDPNAPKPAPRIIDDVQASLDNISRMLY